MRLASYQLDHGPSYGVVTPAGVYDLPARLQEAPQSLRGFIGRRAAGDLPEPSFSGPPDRPLESLWWLPVIPDPLQIFCVGLNYRKHAAEVGRSAGDKPTIFLRTAPSQVGHLGGIIRPKVSTELDFEGELALIIGRPGRYIAAADAFDHIAGYSPYNDASLRDWQRHSPQYTPGKNFVATGAFGPWMTTADEIDDPSLLTIRTTVNGQVVQDAPVSDLIFTIPVLVEYISQFSELQPGDVILTGTPSGVGSMRKPQLWLKPGDQVEVEISGLGLLSNPIVSDPLG